MPSVEPPNERARRVGRALRRGPRLPEGDGGADEPAAAAPATSGTTTWSPAASLPDRVLVIIVATLVLAMLVNADALVARAERRPRAGPATGPWPCGTRCRT